MIKIMNASNTKERNSYQLPAEHTNSDISYHWKTKYASTADNDNRAGHFTKEDGN